MRAWLIAPCLGAALLALPYATAAAGQGARGAGGTPHVHLSAPFHIVPRSRSAILANPRFVGQRFVGQRHRRFGHVRRSSDLGFGSFLGVAGLPDVGTVVEAAPATSAPEAAALPVRFTEIRDLPPCRERVAGVLVERGMACSHGLRPQANRQQ